MTTRLIRFTPRETPVDDSGREPDGVTHQVRFCEGGGTYPKGDSRCYSPEPHVRFGGRGAGQPCFPTSIEMKFPPE